MSELLNMKENYRWDLTGIEFALRERIGNVDNFIGRQKEMEFLYNWYQMIKSKQGDSIAFLGRRKTGKTVIMERLYNIIYSEHDGVIPFYFEFKEGKITGKKFAEEFIVSFYMQLVSYYTRNKLWTRRALDKKNKVSIDELIVEIKELNLKYKDIIMMELNAFSAQFKRENSPYDYVMLVTSAPDAFANKPGVKEKVAQIIDEFQYLNSEIDAGKEKIPSKCYMSTAESKVAPLLVTGSLMGVLSKQLMRYTPHRFQQVDVPTMDEKESIAMTLNYGKIYGYNFSEKLAKYIVHITNNIPGRIKNLLKPIPLYKPVIKSINDVDEALYYEVEQGEIVSDWEEYLSLAMDKYNDQNLKKLTYFLCKTEGRFFTAKEIKEEMGLKIEIGKLRAELELLHKYDLIEKKTGAYGGVYDPTLKKVLMVHYRDILELDMKDFKEHFKTDDILTDLEKEIVQLQLSIEEKEEYEERYKRVQGMYNQLKGEAYEREVLMIFLDY